MTDDSASTEYRRIGRFGPSGLPGGTVVATRPQTFAQPRAVALAKTAGAHAWHDLFTQRTVAVFTGPITVFRARRVNDTAGGLVREACAAADRLGTAPAPAGAAWVSRCQRLLR